MRYPKFPHRARGHLRATKMALVLVQAGRGAPLAVAIVRCHKRREEALGGRLRGKAAALQFPLGEPSPMVRPDLPPEPS
jgi:hypothetical protein